MKQMIRTILLPHLSKEKSKMIMQVGQVAQAARAVILDPHQVVLLLSLDLNSDSFLMSSKKLYA